LAWFNYWLMSITFKKAFHLWLPKRFWKWPVFIIVKFKKKLVRRIKTFFIALMR